MTVPRKGDRVRAKPVEGVVSRISPSGVCHVRRDDSSESSYFPGQLEVIEPARPEWWPPQVGDVVRDEAGRIIVRGKDGWGGLTMGQLAATYPLDWVKDADLIASTLLVRDGKPYGGAS